MIVTTSIPEAPAIGRRTILRNALAIGSLLALPAAVAGRPLPAAAALSDQDMADLARVEQYMDSIITLQARFQQVEPNGRLAFGSRVQDAAVPSGVAMLLGRSRIAFITVSPALSGDHAGT